MIVNGEITNIQPIEDEEEPMLQLSVDVCPSLIRNSLHELFPTPEVVNSDKLALLTLQFNGGDVEQGARKVLYFKCIRNYILVNIFLYLFDICSLY